MEITFPNPSTPRHDRNPKRRINYGLSGQRELADQGQSWHRSILDLVPRLNKYLRTFGDWGRAEIDEVHLWIFPESDGRWYLGEGFCTLLHLIFATDKEVMNPKWRLASRINKHLDFSCGSNTQQGWAPRPALWGGGGSPSRKNYQNRGEVAGQNKGPNINFLQ